jgi:hypothetical protein
MTTHIQYCDRDFLLSASEPDDVELLRQEIAELTSEVSIKKAELRSIELSLAGTVSPTRLQAS